MIQRGPFAQRQALGSPRLFSAAEFKQEQHTDMGNTRSRVLLRAAEPGLAHGVTDTCAAVQ